MEIQRWYAHSGKSGDQSDWQLLADHLQATEELAGRFGKHLGLEKIASLSGLFHDLGKYDPDFPKVLRGENVRVDHSTAGARMLMDIAFPSHKHVAEIAGYAICGHHAGLPDKRNATNSCLAYRIENYTGRLDPAWKSLAQADFTQPGVSAKRCS